MSTNMSLCFLFLFTFRNVSNGSVSSFVIMQLEKLFMLFGVRLHIVAPFTLERDNFEILRQSRQSETVCDQNSKRRKQRAPA